MEDLPGWMEMKAICMFGMWPNSFVRILRVKKHGASGNEMEAWTPTERPGRTQID